MLPEKNEFKHKSKNANGTCMRSWDNTTMLLGAANI